MMYGYDREKALAFIMKHLKKKDFPEIWTEVATILSEFIAYDQQYMCETGVLDEEGLAGENDYDQDEALEFIYESWLNAHPGREDDELAVAALLDAYLEWNEEFLIAEGLA